MSVHTDAHRHEMSSTTKQHTSAPVALRPPIPHHYIGTKVLHGTLNNNVYRDIHCIDFAQGRCLRGSSCKYVHLPGSLLLSLGNEVDHEWKALHEEFFGPIQLDSQICRHFFRHQICRFGDACKFVHIFNNRPNSTPHAMHPLLLRRAQLQHCIDAKGQSSSNSNDHCASQVFHLPPNFDTW